jgi:hypothetical protein
MFYLDLSSICKKYGDSRRRQEAGGRRQEAGGSKYLNISFFLQINGCLIYAVL